MLVFAFMASLCLAKPVVPIRAQVLALDSSAAVRWRIVSMEPLARPGETSRFQLYRSPLDTKDLGWLIDVDGLLVSRVRQTDSSFVVLRYWDFGAVVSEEPPENSSRSLAPVLYPVGRDRWAMAVLTSHSTGYSGGGASWTWATFHELRDLAAPEAVKEGGLELLYQAIPFRCSKGIRACFSEQEYRKSKSCQETWVGGLRLRYGLKEGSGLFAWTADWEETHTPGGLVKGKREVERKEIDLEDPPTTQCTEPID